MLPDWTIGLEIETIAPPGSSRLALAEAIAAEHGGTVRPFFHPQSEPSKIPGTAILENLTLGYEVVGDRGQLLVKCVDDLTLQADCQKAAAPVPGWYRIVSDDPRLLELIDRVACAKDPLENVLEPLAKLFEVGLIAGPDKMFKVSTESGATVAIAAPLPGERERPCELILPPLLRSELEAVVSDYLQIARQMGFRAPLEGATHVHIDATFCQSAAVFKNLVNLLWAHGPNLRQLFGMNPHCRRVNLLPPALWEVVNAPDWTEQSWERARDRLKSLNLSKYSDFNLRNPIYQTPHKNTIEVRILPVYLEPEPLLQAVDLVQALFARCLRPVSASPPVSWDETTVFLNELDLTERCLNYRSGRQQSITPGE